MKYIRLLIGIAFIQFLCFVIANEDQSYALETIEYFLNELDVEPFVCPYVIVNVGRTQRCAFFQDKQTEAREQWKSMYQALSKTKLDLPFPKPDGECVGGSVTYCRYRFSDGLVDITLIPFEEASGKPYVVFSAISNDDEERLQYYEGYNEEEKRLARAISGAKNYRQIGLLFGDLIEVETPCRDELKVKAPRMSTCFETELSIDNVIANLNDAMLSADYGYTSFSWQGEWLIDEGVAKRAFTLEEYLETDYSYFVILVQSQPHNLIAIQTPY